MRLLQYLVAASLDGMICQPDGSFDCFPQEGDHIPDYLAALDRFDAVVMGRKTYEVGLREGQTDPYPKLETHVFSRTLKESPNPRVRVVADDPAGYVRELKNKPGGPIYLCGGSILAGELFRNGLIDEIVVKLNPLLVGRGIPLFAGLDEPANLELFDTKRYECGVVLLSYRPAARS